MTKHLLLPSADQENVLFSNGTFHLGICVNRLVCTHKQQYTQVRDGPA